MELDLVWSDLTHSLTVTVFVRIAMFDLRSCVIWAHCYGSFGVIRDLEQVEEVYMC